VIDAATGKHIISFVVASPIWAAQSQGISPPLLYIANYRSISAYNLQTGLPFWAYNFSRPGIEVANVLFTRGAASIFLYVESLNPAIGTFNFSLVQLNPTTSPPQVTWSSPGVPANGFGIMANCNLVGAFGSSNIESILTYTTPPSLFSLPGDMSLASLCAIDSKGIGVFTNYSYDTAAYAVVVIDLNTNTLLWTTEFANPYPNATPLLACVVANGNIVVLSEQGADASGYYSVGTLFVFSTSGTPCPANLQAGGS
jgi:hypothetical protein